MLRNHWYVGCASSQLKYDLLSSDLLGEPIVLFRDDQGTPHALLDRCCHRGFPLSRSKIKNGRIECGFHGWQYSYEGQVLRVPSQREDKALPGSFCVPSFPCAERDGYVWVWGGDSAPTSVPEFPEIHHGSWMQGSRIIECNYLRALEITFDVPHVYFLHPTHPATQAAAKYGFAESPMELRITESGCILFQPPTSSEADPVPKDGFMMEFSLPGRIRFLANGNPYMTFFTMPVGPNRCRMDWIIMDWEPSKPPSQGIRWTGDGGQVIAEDQIALELIQKAYEREEEAFEHSVEADTPTLLLRRIMKAAEAGEFGKKDLGPARRILRILGASRYE